MPGPIYLAGTYAVRCLDPLNDEETVEFVELEAHQVRPYINQLIQERRPGLRSFARVEEDAVPDA